MLSGESTKSGSTLAERGADGPTGGNDEQSCLAAKEAQLFAGVFGHRQASAMNAASLFAPLFSSPLPNAALLHHQPSVIQHHQVTNNRTTCQNSFTSQKLVIQQYRYNKDDEWRKEPQFG